MINLVTEESEKHFHQLADQFINLRENERKRVSDELHDGVGQALAAIKFQVESVVSESKNTSRRRKNDLILIDMLENIKIALIDLRRISVDLRSSVIDDLGLVMALKRFVGEYRKVYTNLTIDFKLDVSETKISDDIKNVIYRLVQEATNNIARHAIANNIKLELTESNDGLLLKISDDGCGFDICEVKKKLRPGLGLISMEERATQSGATFTISSNSLMGTTIIIFWREI